MARNYTPAADPKHTDASVPRCDECGRAIPDGVPPIWDVLLSAMFCSLQCQWRYRRART